MHEIIAKFILEKIKENPSLFEKEINPSLSLEEAQVLLFKYPTVPTSKRLTSLGFKILKTFVESYKITTPEDFQLNGKTVLFLEKMGSVYYIHSKWNSNNQIEAISVFDPEEAVTIKLVGWDIDSLSKL